MMDNIENSIFQSLNESSKIIFKALLDEAEHTVRYYLRKGLDTKSAVDSVVANFDLTENETAALCERIKKPEPVAINRPKVDDVIIKTEATTDDNNRQRVIYFEATEEMNEAVQILMDKSIDWSEKDVNVSRPFIQFSDDAKLAEAQSALRRKWDFVEGKKRLVAN